MYERMGAPVSGRHCEVSSSREVQGSSHAHRHPLTVGYWSRMEWMVMLQTFETFIWQLPSGFEHKGEEVEKQDFQRQLNRCTLALICILFNRCLFFSRLGYPLPCNWPNELFEYLRINTNHFWAGLL